MLAVGLVTTAAVGGVAVARAGHELAALQKTRDVQAGQDRAASAKELNDLKTADLSGKLQRVGNLDQAVDAEFARWQSGSVKFGVLGRAIVACDNAIDAYDTAAAPFPDGLLPAGVPPQINTANPGTDCGRAFTRRL